MQSDELLCKYPGAIKTINSDTFCNSLQPVELRGAYLNALKSTTEVRLNGTDFMRAAPAEALTAEGEAVGITSAAVCCAGPIKCRPKLC